MTQPDVRPQPRVIDLSVEVPGTPEEVWEAVATGPGSSSWFMAQEVEPREGGAVRMDMGEGFVDAGRVAAWEPPRRFVGEADQGGCTLAYEWLVEARDGGSCVVRLVASGFGEGADWDAEYQGQSAGWQVFLAHLRVYLTHFRGSTARLLPRTQPTTVPQDETWARFCGALGWSTDLAAGEKVLVDAPPLAGTVEDTLRLPGATAALLLLGEPAPGTALLLAEGRGGQSMMSVWLYLHGDEAAAAPDLWGDWLATHLGEPAPA